MELKFTCEHARGADVHSAQFAFFDACDTLEEARESVRSRILAQIDREDRGEGYDWEWACLADEAKTAEPGDVLTFDERHWRIICGGDDD